MVKNALFFTAIVYFEINLKCPTFNKYVRIRYDPHVKIYTNTKAANIILRLIEREKIGMRSSSNISQTFSETTRGRNGNDRSVITGHSGVHLF